MRLKEIKPGMVIHCKNDEEKKALLEEAERLGYLWLTGNKPTNVFFPSNTLIFREDDLNKIIYWTGDSENHTEFSDLILPELTAEEVLNTISEMCNNTQCKNCYLGKYCDKTNSACSLQSMEPKLIIDACIKWKSDHEKKEPEIETVDICRIIEIQPDGRKRCVHEEDIKSELPFGGDERQIVQNILKRYLAEHDGEFIAVHEVVSMVKR